jgi:TPP-dependent pyruvate/acetoin dehydrogenase alpha subunit
MFDPERYRQKAEVEEWKRHDPIQGLRDRMAAEGILVDADVEAMEVAIRAIVDDAAAFAEASPLEDVADLELFVHSPQSSVLRRRPEREEVAP